MDLDVPCNVEFKDKREIVEKIYISPHGSIIPAVGKDVQGFFIFCRKLVRNKTKQSTEKVSEHNRSTVFLSDLVLCGHQQEWCQLCLIIYPLFITLTHNLRQLPFSPPPPPLTDYAAPLVRECMRKYVTVFDLNR